MKLEQEYFLMIEDKNNNIAFYNENSRLMNNFDKNVSFEAITKPKTSKYSALSLIDTINQLIYVLNKFYFLKKGYIIRINNDKKKVIFEIERNRLKDFLTFYKGDD